MRYQPRRLFLVPGKGEHHPDAEIEAIQQGEEEEKQNDQEKHAILINLCIHKLS